MAKYYKLIGGRIISQETLDEFREVYTKQGWRAVERIYTNRTDTLNQMIALAGLKPKRKMKTDGL